MSDYYIKSLRGRQALRERSHSLPRSTRNLLLILDASRPVRHWLEMVRGADWADVAVLIRAGFIEPVASPGAPETRPAGMLSEFQSDFAASDFHVSHGPGEDSLAVVMRRPAVPVQAAPVASAPTRVPVRPMPFAPPLRPTAVDEGLNSGFMPLDRLTPTAASGAASSPLGYADLYDSLNALVRQTLGLFTGYRYVLRIERARDVVELRQVAADFVREVRRRQGESVSRVVQRALGLETPQDG